MGGVEDILLCGQQQSEAECPQQGSGAPNTSIYQRAIRLFLPVGASSSLVCPCQLTPILAYWLLDSAPLCGTAPAWNHTPQVAARLCPAH